MLALRFVRQANHESCNRLRLQMGVRIHRDHERCRHGREGGIERVVLALVHLENASVVEPQASTRCVCEACSVVRRVVVRDDDLDPARV